MTDIIDIQSNLPANCGECLYSMPLQAYTGKVIGDGYELPEPEVGWELICTLQNDKVIAKGNVGMPGRDIPDNCPLLLENIMDKE